MEFLQTDAEVQLPLGSDQEMLKVAVAGPLADPKEGGIGIFSPAAKPLDGIGDSHAEIVVHVYLNVDVGGDSADGGLAEAG